MIDRTVLERGWATLSVVVPTAVVTVVTAVVALANCSFCAGLFAAIAARVPLKEAVLEDRVALVLTILEDIML